MNIKGKTVLITGASAGIGYACAEIFAEAGCRLILLARRKNRLDELAAALRNIHGNEILTLECDIRFEKQVESSMQLPDYWQKIDILINNAGLARGIEKFQDGMIENWEEMIDTNIKGLLYVTRHILPQMIERGTGDIINVASIAGRDVYPGGNVYCATKHAIKGLSSAMIVDLNGTGVRVTSLDPGLVETEFASVRFNGDNDKASKVYEGYKPLSGRDVAECALFCVTRPPHVSIQDLLVTPTAQATTMLVYKK
ncbi:MAG: family oxidoreductase [Bacteroidota bacterium]|nr:family oxidoreductase [Bacteroidota bacterium]